jgi:hypothetical protein
MSEPATSAPDSKNSDNAPLFKKKGKSLPLALIFLPVSVYISTIKKQGLDILDALKQVGKRNLKSQKAVAHAARALQLFGIWV